MKKFLALVLALAMVFALAACGSGAPAASAPAESKPAAEAPSASETAEAPADYIECEPMTLTYTCSATDNTCWADIGRQLNAYLSERTNGAITVETYAQDQLTNGSQTEGIQAVIDGTIDMSAHSNLIYSNFDQRLNVVSLPFNFTSVEEVDALLSAGGAGYEALAPIVEGLGLHLLGIGENGFRHFTNSVRPVDTLEAMKGLKLRVAGAKVLNNAYGAWGANWSNANWSEVYTGLQTGTYEGQENPLPTADGASIADVQKYVTYWTGVYDCLFLTINADVYNSCSPEVQALLDEAGDYVAAMQRDKQRNGGVSYDGTVTYKGDADILAAWEAKGITVSTLSDEEVVKFQEAVVDVPQMFVDQCVELGFDKADVEALVAAFGR